MIGEKKLVEELKENNFDILMTDADCFGLEKCTENVIELINKQPKVGEWIPCSERLPEAEQEVLLQLEDNMVVGFYLVEGGHFDGTTNWYGLGDNDIYTDCGSKPIAWMPLPEPYKPDSVDIEKPEWKDRMMQTFLGGRR